MQFQSFTSRTFRAAVHTLALSEQPASPQQAKFAAASFLCSSPAWLSHTPNLPTARAFPFFASSSRFFGGEFVSSERRRRVEMPAI